MFSNSIQSFVAAAAVATGAEALALPQTDDAALSTSSHVQPFSGPIADLDAPIFDGPVRWGQLSPRATAGQITAVSGAIGCAFFMTGSLVAFTCMLHEEASRKNVLKILGAGVALGSLGAGGFALSKICDDSQGYRSVTFATHVSHIEYSDGGHVERTGKASSATFHTQLLSIPESNIPLAVRVMDTPFVEGETIVASFYYGENDHRVYCWEACPDRRAETTNGH